MRYRKPLIALLVLGATLLLAAAIVYLLYARDTTPSLPEITPPRSLEDLAEEYPDLAHILTDPELGSVYKEFLVVYEEEGEEAAIEMARQRGMLTPDGDVRATLILDTEDNEPLVAQLAGIGITDVTAYRDQVNVAVPLEMIKAQLASEDPGAIFARLTELEHVIAVRLPDQRVSEGSTIEGEGVDIIDGDDWHDAGFTGAGLRIGVLDLGFAGYQDLLGVELPDDVTIETFGWYDEEEIHGTACAEIIHEVAPGADLYLAWYDGSDAAMGMAVEWLESYGVDIISHSAGGLVGPRDGSEWDAQLVDDLATRGILWVNSAGNAAQSHYRGIFSDEDGDGFHEFAPGEQMLALYNRGYVKVFLSWEDDWEAASRDYELFLYDAAGNELDYSVDEQSGEAGQRPVEGIWYETGGDTVYAVVSAFEIDQAVILDIFVHGADVEYPSADHSICPPADAVRSLTVGAANWWDDSLASYSSQGPTSDGRLKPEISAPAGVSGASYGMEEFHGTSASCPHVAGAAALVWQAHPEFDRQQVVDFLLNNALDLGVTGPDTGFGFGRLQLLSPPSEAPPPPTHPCPPRHTGTTPPAHAGTAPSRHTGTASCGHTGTTPSRYTGTAPSGHPHAFAHAHLNSRAAALPHASLLHHPDASSALGGRDNPDGADRPGSGGGRTGLCRSGPATRRRDRSAHHDRARTAGPTGSATNPIPCTLRPAAFHAATAGPTPHASRTSTASRAPAASANALPILRRSDTSRRAILPCLWPSPHTGNASPPTTLLPALRCPVARRNQLLLQVRAAHITAPKAHKELETSEVC